MKLELNYHSESPLYEQIIYQIRKRIIFGEFAAGMPLPSIRELSHDLKLSAGTVKKAYSALKTEGIIYVVPGNGYFVSEKSSALCENKIKQIKERAGELSKILKDNGFTQEDIVAIVNESWPSKV